VCDIWIIYALILGIVQGLTEFMPISSSGHLILIPWLFKWLYFGKTFDVALHLGTFLGVVVYYRSTLSKLFRAWALTIARKDSNVNPEGRLAWLLIVSTIPGAVAGFLFEETIEEKLSSPVIIALMLVVAGVVLFVAERAGRKRKDIVQVEMLDAVIIGISQAAALIPGVSRSGATISTGLFLGFDRKTSAEYSFLLSVPIIGGAAMYKAVRLLKTGIPFELVAPFAFGLLAAAISGYLCIKYLLRYLQNGSIYPFVYYRWAVGIVVLILAVTRW
jgi:undecaprenyl-diphosphatase